MTVTETRATPRPRRDILIGGDWRAPATRETIAVINPSDGETIGEIARGGGADIDAAVVAARAALDGPWGRLPAVERGRLLTKLAGAVVEHHDALALAEAADTGKPLRQARADITALARYFEFYAGACDKVHGEMLPYLDGYTVMTLREPYGVTGHIIPWNHPAQIFGRSVGAALGNACVVKPAEDASLSILSRPARPRCRLPARRPQHRAGPWRGGGRGARRSSRHLGQEEVFGPVLCAMRFRDEAEALRLANGMPYGLVAGVWTQDSGRQLRLARALKSGQVFINNFGAGGGVELPFGGVKRSGHGREKGFEALFHFSTLKTIAIKHG
jgi:acyl-CoA reductase-like NAD-dependent aldehyde dehydrogenase